MTQFQASPSHICNAISVRLDETNYPIWFFQMHHLLRSQGLLKFVDGSHLCPPPPLIPLDGVSNESPSPHEKWFKQDSFIISIINNSLSPDALNLIIGCQSAMEVWLTLKQRYAPVSVSHIMQLKFSLFHIQKGYDSIEKYLLRFKMVRDKLAIVGVQIPDEEIKFLILAGLPCEYGHTRQIIRSKYHVSMEEVRSLLLSAEFELELKHRSSFMSHLMVPQCGSPNYVHNQVMYKYGFHNGNGALPCMSNSMSYVNEFEKVRSSLLSTESEIGCEHRALPLSSHVCMIAQNVHANYSPQSVQYGTASVDLIPTVANSCGFFGIPVFNHYKTSPTTLEVHHYNAPPGSTSHFGMQQYNVLSSSAPTIPLNYQDMLSFSTNISVPHTMPNSGIMLNNNAGNGSDFSPPASACSFAPQTGGFTNQNGGLMAQNGEYTPASQYSFTLQGFSENIHAHSNMQEHQKSFSQAANNSCFGKGYTDYFSTDHGLGEFNSKEARGTPDFHTLSESALANTSPSSKKMEGLVEASKTSQMYTETREVDHTYVTESGKLHKGGVTSKAGSEIKPTTFIPPKALSASITTQSSLSLALPNKMPGLNHYKNRNLMNHRESCASTTMWRSLPLIPPG